MCMLGCGGYTSYSGVYDIVYGKNIVLKRRVLYLLRLLRFAISVEIHSVTAVMVFVSGCCHVEIGKTLCGFGESVVSCGGFNVLFK